MIAHRRGRVIVIDERARRPIRLMPREKRATYPANASSAIQIDSTR